MGFGSKIKAFWNRLDFDESQSIDRFKTNFDVGARANRFSVNLLGPQGLALEGLRCESVTLPGRQLAAEAWSAYGPLQHRVYNIDHDGNQITMVFRCDSSFFDRLIIEGWQSMIFSAGDSGNSFHPVFEYYDDYVGTVEITQRRKDNSPALKYILQEAFPIAYAAQELSMTTVDDILKFSVTFAFRTFDTEYVAPEELGGFFGGLNKGRKYLDIALDILKLGSRYNKKAGSILTKLDHLDSNLARGGQILGGIKLKPPAGG